MNKPREFWLAGHNPLDECSDMHVYSSKPIWSDDSIHVQEIPEGSIVLSREEFKDVISKCINSDETYCCGRCSMPSMDGLTKELFGESIPDKV